MSLKEFGAKLLAKHYHKKISQWKSNPLDSQKKTFQKLIQKGKDTQFGKDHKFGNIKNIDDFQKLVPVGDYELLKPYIEQILD